MKDVPSMDGAPCASSPVAECLLAWYAQARRDLPWRHTRDPYRIWVAEVMLAQTRVATVIPYYERFLRLFPDVATLAATPLDDVLKAWEGLGYYARARHLHRAAQEIVACHGGRIPDDPAALRHLPGIGAYTAAALLSIAFGRDEPALDANVRRVLSRLFAVGGAPEVHPTQARLEALARSILPVGRAGAFNQAMMDLGATICAPRRPRCEACPLADDCEARQRGMQEALPVRRRRREVPHHEVCAAVISRGGRILIAQRPDDGLLGGLWEFPGGKREAGETLADCLRREMREELGVEIEVGERVATVQHAYTHLTITLHAFRCRLVAGEPRAIACARWRWVHHEGLGRFAFSAADRKVIAALQAQTDGQVSGHCGRAGTGNHEWHECSPEGGAHS